jgi:hypothetical protein
LGISFASVRELGYFINLAPRLGLVDGNRLADAETLQGRTAAALAALIKSLN